MTIEISEDAARYFLVRHKYALEVGVPLMTESAGNDWTEAVTAIAHALGCRDCCAHPSL